MEFLCFSSFVCEKTPKKICRAMPPFHTCARRPVAQPVKSHDCLAVAATYLEDFMSRTGEIVSCAELQKTKNFALMLLLPAVCWHYSALRA